MTIKLLCAIGIHAWNSDPAVFTDQMELDLDLPEIPAKRKCSCCGKEQTMTVLEVNIYTGKTIKTWG